MLEARLKWIKCLPSNCEALSSNPSTAKEKRKKYSGLPFLSPGIQIVLGHMN
jgi:hypothetical protein